MMIGILADIVQIIMLSAGANTLLTVVSALQLGQGRVWVNGSGENSLKGQIKSKYHFHRNSYDPIIASKWFVTVVAL